MAEQERLIAAWRRGDFDAFLQLVRPHLVSLRALVVFYGPPATSLWETDDLAQDALIEAFQSIGQFDPARGEIRSWLGGVVRNRVRRAWQESLRERKRRQNAVTRAMEMAGSPEGKLDPEARPLVEALRECLEKLPEQGGKMVRAHYAERLSGEEIAERFKVTLPAVYVTLHRVRRALRQCVESRSGFRVEGVHP